MSRPFSVKEMFHEGVFYLAEKLCLILEITGQFPHRRQDGRFGDDFGIVDDQDAVMGEAVCGTDFSVISFSGWVVLWMVCL